MLDGIITTVAGNGNPGFSGDGGPATSAQLNFPYGVAVDRSGNLYIADSSNARIRKVGANGIISTYAGTGSFSTGIDGQAASTPIGQPYTVAVDPAGNVYVANFLRIMMISPDGQVTNIAGSNSTNFSGEVFFTI